MSDRSPAAQRRRSAGQQARRRPRRPGWVPNQHGAWAMLVVPFVVGALEAGPSWRHLPLLFTWLAGYFAFFAAGLWLRSRGKRRYWPPVRAYAVLTVVLGLVAIAVEPDLLHWAVVFLPLLAFSLWFSWRRLDRSLLNDAVTVLAACLMTVMAAGLGERAGERETPSLAGLAWLPGADQARTWVLAGLLLAYFAGTVLYVKTMIRDRGDVGRYRLSVTYRVAICVPAAIVSPWLGALFAAFAVRAAVVPKRWPGLAAARIGVGEIVASLALATMLLLA
ncbi:MAG: YwiC-like family protein [Mycobacteriaceae bacterium]